MYLHLGRDIVVPKSGVVGIFDLDNTTGSVITRDYLNAAERNGRVVSVSDELPKSFIVFTEGDATTIYLSQLSPGTLLKRSEADIVTLAL